MIAQVVEPRPGIDMGRVTVWVEIENLFDRHQVLLGQRSDSEIRRCGVEELVDSGAAFFCLPSAVIEKLGLTYHRTRETRTIHGPCQLRIFGVAGIRVDGRECEVEVMEIPDGRQPLLGQIPLKTLDFWIDLTNRRLVGNPEHGGQWMAEITDVP